MKYTRKELEKCLDYLWALCIAIRDERLCQYSLKQSNKKQAGMEAHHIFSRSHKSTRWDLDNGILLRAMHNTSPAHKDPEKFRRFLVDKFMAPEKYEALYHKANLTKKWSIHELLDLKEKLETELYQLINFNENKSISGWALVKISKWPKKWDIFA